MTIDLQIGFAGRFKIEKIRPDGERIVASDWQSNLITDNGLNMFGNLTSGNLNAYCQVGSGTAAPSVTDVNLAAFVASTSNTSSSTSGYTTTPGNRYEWSRNSYEFAAGTATGNISEFGISPSSNGNLFSRALIKDEQGNPTTITVLADEILVVTYELRMYKPENDFVGTSNGYNYTARIANCDIDSWWSLPLNRMQMRTSNFEVYTGGIGSITGTPSGSYSTASSGNVFTNSYVNNSFERTGGAKFTLNQANFVIRSCAFRFGGFAFQVEISPTITKNNSQELTIEHTISWGRHVIQE